METQTHTPVKYENLTPEQKKEIVNGCGGKGGLITPPHAVFFNTSCNHHDYGYFKGCTKKHRLLADRMLYRLMRKDCSTLSFFKKLRYHPWCLAYYLGVRAVGWKFFYYGPEKRYPILGGTN